MPVVILIAGGSNTVPPSLFPDATNTGYRNAPGYTGSLTTYGGGAITSNTTYDHILFAGGADIGSVSVPVSNVTFNGCLFKSAGTALALLFGDNLVFNYCSFEPSNATPPTTFAQGYQWALNGSGAFNTSVQQLTVSHCDLWGWANAIDAFGSTQAKPQVYRDNWIHDARADGGVDHTDGIGSLNGGDNAYVVLNHNTIDSAGNTNGIAYQGTSNTTPYDHFTVTNNLFTGFNQTIAINLSPAGTPSVNPTNTIFTDNTFTTKLKPIDTPLRSNDFWSSSSPISGLWRRNRWLVPPGAAWGNSSNSGLFWMPVTNSIVGVDDSPYVSATDFTG